VVRQRKRGLDEQGELQCHYEGDVCGKVFAVVLAGGWLCCRPVMKDCLKPARGMMRDRGSSLL